MAGRTSWSGVDPRLVAALVGAAWLLLAVHGLGDGPIVGDDEAREAGIVQDVVAGNLWLPRFNQELIPDKPVLSHWLAAIPVALGGFSETTVRLSAAVAGAGAVGWTTLLGARLFGPPAGLAAGLLLGTMPTLFTHARVARPDALLILLLALALGCAWRWWRDDDRRAATWSWAVLGLGVFAKGPVAPALFGVAFGLFLLWERDWRRALRFVTPAGLLLFAAIAGCWYVAGLLGWGEEFVRQHLVGRYVRNLAGGLASGHQYSPRPWWYHLTFYWVHLPAVAMPWTPLVAVALWQGWRADRLQDPRLRFLLCWAVAPAIVFTPAEWKLRYYLLPSLPALALLAAPAAVAAVRAVPSELRPTRGSLAAAAVALLALGAGAYLALLRPDLLSRSDQATLAAALPALGGAGTVAGAVGLVAGVGVVAVACRVWAVVLGLTGLGAILWLAFGAPAVIAETARQDGLADVAHQVSHVVPSDAPLAFWAEPVRPVIVYLGRPVPSLGRQPDKLVPGTWLLSTRAAWRALSEAGLVGEVAVHGTGRLGNLARGELVLSRVTPAAAQPPAALPGLPPREPSADGAPSADD